LSVTRVKRSKRKQPENGQENVGIGHRVAFRADLLDLPHQLFIPCDKDRPDIIIHFHRFGQHRQIGWRIAADQHRAAFTLDAELAADELEAVTLVEVPDLVCFGIVIDGEDDFNIQTGILDPEVLAFGVDVWALISIIQSSAETVTKVLWVVLVLLLPVLGLIVWFLFGPKSR